MRRYAWLSTTAAVLTFPLIALGAIVRLEGAGLACPDWPLCYGRITPLGNVVAPAPEGVKIALEVGHRYLAGFVGLLVFALTGLGWTVFREHRGVKIWSTVALVLLIPQAVLGGLTVLMDLAPITVSLHLIAGNLFFGSLVALTLQASRAADDEPDPVGPDADVAPSPRLRFALLGTLILAGAQIWLGGWVSSSGASMACSTFPTCNGAWELPIGTLQWLQMGHRGTGILVAVATVAVAVLSFRSDALTRGARFLGIALPVMVVGQIVLGVVNVAYYIPVPVSAAHTALAAAMFGVLAYLTARMWLPAPSRSAAESEETDQPSDRTTSAAPGGLAAAWQTVRDYRELTKPRIVHLLVLTAFCTMLVAAGGLPAFALVAWTVVGTTLVCGSAQVVNMVWDRDIDAVMERTSDRPIVQGRIGSTAALVFSALLGVAGTGILWYFANPLAALMGVAGHVYYSVVYTMWLKRTTPQNIVIGGGAGAFPTLIGWTAVTGSLSVTAGLIFAIVFFWTPPHFWALALYKETDYEAAGVPMMPVSRGERTTKFQMLLYTTLLVGTTALLGIVGTMGIVYYASAILLGAGFAFVCVKTAFSEGDRWAKRTFAYSILYLALLFGAMSVDSLRTLPFAPNQSAASSTAERDDKPRPKFEFVPASDPRARVPAPSDSNEEADP